jgi:hypothetical protein
MFCCVKDDLCLQMNIDPLMAFVPPIIINFVLMVMSPVVYRLAKYVVANTSRKSGTQLNDRVKERAAFYDRVDSRVQEYLASKTINKPDNQSHVTHRP